MTNDNDFELFQTYIESDRDIVFEHSNRETNISCYMECAYLDIDNELITVIFRKNWTMPVTSENIQACAEDVMTTIENYYE